MTVWNPVLDPHAGYLFNLSSSLCDLEKNHPDVLISVSDDVMIAASDYSGQHKEATHEAYSFIVTDNLKLNAWLPLLSDFRKNWLLDGRRMSFKKLQEPVRWRALPIFLETISKLKGNLITILVDRKVGSFMFGGADAIIEAFPDCFAANANRGTVEKMFRLANFISLILGGLRSERQPSLWISDHDEALDSDQKREQFALLGRYLTFGLTQWHQPANNYFCTTENPTVPNWSEDLASIADLVAGAYCKMATQLPISFAINKWAGISSKSIQDRRAKIIGQWLNVGNNSLRHVLLRLETDRSGNIRSSAQTFAS